MRRVIFLTFTIVLPALSQTRDGGKEIAVAAASNLTRVFQVVGAEFEKETGIHPVFSFGATASLARQIENGAPWDIFAAADTEHVDQLDRKGLLVRGSNAVYATGILALWIPSRTISLNRLEDLTQPGIRVIAIAKPELAPYGRAARESLEKLGIWRETERKVVFAENISMAKQYGETGNADAVFTALALLRPDEPGKVIPVPETLHSPIRQALGIVAASRNQPAARQFADFLLTGKGRAVLLRNGYR